MIHLSTADINTWIASILWPLSRMLGLIATAPVFGHASTPLTVKLGLGVLLALIVAPTVPALPAADPMSYSGLSMGFSMRIVFASVEFAGQVASLTMGLGFASFFDPASQAQSSAISQFLALLATMMFLTVNGHLVLLAALVESFDSLPISALHVSGAGFKQLADWGATIFSTGLQLSLPIIAALLITNVALGILTRAAPQLNLFGIGFPITLGVGFLVLAMALPTLSTPLQNLFLRGVEEMRHLPRTWAGRDVAAPSPTLPAAPHHLNK